jgi:hypothetical protein
LLLFRLKRISPGGGTEEGERNDKLDTPAGCGTEEANHKI